MLGKIINDIFAKEPIGYTEKAENLVYQIKSCSTREFRDAYYRFLIEKPNLETCSVTPITDYNGYLIGHMIFVKKSEHSRTNETIKTVDFEEKENQLNVLIPNYLYYFIANPFDNLALLYENFSLKNPELELLSISKKSGQGFYIFTKKKSPLY